jgi:hypothetical protein
MQLSVIVRDEYEKAERSGRPWNFKSCREEQSNTTHSNTTQSNTTPKVRCTQCPPLPPKLPSLPFFTLAPPCQAICVYDEAAGTLAGHVLHKLRSLHLLPKESEMELIQGLAVALRRKGFGVALHTARGTAVKYQVLPLHLLKLLHPTPLPLLAHFHSLSRSPGS